MHFWLPFEIKTNLIERFIKYFLFSLFLMIFYQLFFLWKDEMGQPFVLLIVSFLTISAMSQNYKKDDEEINFVNILMFSANCSFTVFFLIWLVTGSSLSYFLKNYFVPEFVQTSVAYALDIRVFFGLISLLVFNFIVISMSFKSGNYDILTDPTIGKFGRRGFRLFKRNFWYYRNEKFIDFLSYGTMLFVGFMAFCHKFKILLPIYLHVFFIVTCSVTVVIGLLFIFSWMYVAIKLAIREEDVLRRQALRKKKKQDSCARKL